MSDMKASQIDWLLVRLAKRLHRYLTPRLQPINNYCGKITFCLDFFLLAFGLKPVPKQFRRKTPATTETETEVGHFNTSRTKGWLCLREFSVGIAATFFALRKTVLFL